MKIVLLVFIGIIAMSTTSVRNARMISKLTVFENLITPLTSTYIEINGGDESINYRDGDVRNDADLIYADTVINDGTLDLTSLTNTLGESMDLTGQVIMAVKFLVEDDSAAIFTISQGESDPYPLFGDTYSIELKANQSLLFKCDSVLIPVASGAKTIDYDSSNDSTALYIILISADAYI